MEEDIIISYGVFEFKNGLGSQGGGSSYSEKEEEPREEDMVDQDLDSIAQQPLSLLDNLHKMPRHLENLLSKFDPDKKTKEEYYIDNFYMHIQMLEVKYDDVSCRIFSFTLEGIAIAWYHSLPANSIHS